MSDMYNTFKPLIVAFNSAHAANTNTLAKQQGFRELYRSFFSDDNTGTIYNNVIG